MCLYPKLRKNPKYLPNKKNGGQVPSVSDSRVIAVPTACGRCMECMKKKSREWQVRLLEDIRHNKNGKFVTFTFSNESITELIKIIAEKEETDEWNILEKGYELDNQIATIAMRRFNERWRKAHKKAIRHWMVTELGHNGTENIHLHGIVWTNENLDEVEKHWQYGTIWKGKGHKRENYVNEKTVNYITKYINKTDEKHTEYKPKVLTSPGIGAAYTDRIDSKLNKYGEDTKEYYTTRTGHKIAMPTYWRNKIYTDEEKEKLWIKKLDQNVRFVNGIKIDISTKEGEEKYYKTLKHQRKRAKRLGYQDDKVNWSQKQYEEQRRLLLVQKRIKG